MKKLIKTLVLITIVSQSSFAQSTTGGHVTLLKKNASMATSSTKDGSSTSVNNTINATPSGMPADKEAATNFTAVEGKKSDYIGHVTLLK